MGFTENIRFCREKIRSCMYAKDASGVRGAIVSYIMILTKMKEQLSSMSDRAYIDSMIGNYKMVAAIATKEGIGQRAWDAYCSISENYGVQMPVLGHKPIPVPPKSVPSSPKSVPAPPEPAFVSADEWVAELFERYSPATLEIVCGSSAGTGFFISPKGYLLTNHHVIEGSRNSVIASYDEKIHGDAKVIASDKKRDVALMKFCNLSAGETTPYIPIMPDYSTFRRGSAVMIIGNGLGRGLAPASGTVRFCGHEEESEDLVYNILTNPGDSGSPVLNRQGYCVGINKAREEAVIGPSINGFSLATPSVDIQTLLNKWTKAHNIEL